MSDDTEVSETAAAETAHAWSAEPEAQPVIRASGPMLLVNPRFFDPAMRRLA
jgi:hypothetical protein